MFAVQLLQASVLRLAPRVLVLAGAGLWIAGLLLLLSTSDALSYYVANTLFGLGAGCLLPGVMAGASLAAGNDNQGIAAGLVSASQGIGFIIGPAVSAALYMSDKTLPFWILIGIMVLLFLGFTAIPLHNQEHQVDGSNAEEGACASSLEERDREATARASF